MKFLSNDENSTDEELIQWFNKEGKLTEKQAKEWVAKREMYLFNIVIEDKLTEKQTKKLVAKKEIYPFNTIIEN